MDDTQDTIVVFTARSPGRIVEEGGSQAWVLNPARAKLCSWLVCTQNRHNPDHEFSDATEPHCSAFLLAKVSGVAPPNDGSDSDRWLITISEFARINVPDVWDHGRNPVRYTTLDELGIKLDGLDFKPLPAASHLASESGVGRREPSLFLKGMTIDEAKKGLAMTFGVKPEAVEITIRG
jgi:hypothetical protein